MRVLGALYRRATDRTAEWKLDGLCRVEQEVLVGRGPRDAADIGRVGLDDDYPSIVFAVSCNSIAAAEDANSSAHAETYEKLNAVRPRMGCSLPGGGCR